MNCRFCHNQLKYKFLSLGLSPFSNSFLTQEHLKEEEPFYPLEAYVCDNCFLVQVDEFEKPENIFGEYAYFSSYSDTWLKHAEKYVSKMLSDFSINRDSSVIEIASNDGYLLQYFVAAGIPVLGIEPARNVAEVAISKGIPTEVLFFGTKTARRLADEGKQADLILGNNVLAHVPALNDFVLGLKILLKAEGFITMEFPHLMRLMDDRQFDTIYHEHFSYFSLLTAERIFSHHGLKIFDVEQLPTHGGSLRIYAAHKENRKRKTCDSVERLKQKEKDAGYLNIKFYLGFQSEVEKIKEQVLEFLNKVKAQKKSIVGYGAAAKGNTLLNYCGIKQDTIEYVADRNPYKQKRYLPGSHILIEAPEKIRQTKPDYIFILPWNIKEEIMEQLSFVREWGGKFVVPIPQVTVI